MMGAVEGRRCGNGGWGIEGRWLQGNESEEAALVCSGGWKRRWEGWGEGVRQLGHGARMAAGGWWLVLMEGGFMGGRKMAVVMVGQ